ncbi:DUF3667 domain-containing protein [Janthinobacterium sp.]|uniref:DUF3667 domain-containing protein n=1 Tax=Janthinobacterium sp. TaxID=1871054 RepID=UPI00293D76DD|nr:DUF3667 domain-containing protein [Janthinobacterium sp.]
MALEVESVGTLITAGPTGGAPEDAAGKPAGHEGGAAQCANCATALAGHYCHACGQAAHLHHSLLHLGEEVLHGILHFDAKAWRTLPMLVTKPGALTRRYVDGQRTRYVSPLGLFLFMMFFMFFVYSYTSEDLNVDGPSPKSEAAFRAGVNAKLERHTARIAAAEVALEAARRSGAAVEEASETLREERMELASEAKLLGEFAAAPSHKGAAGAKTAAVDEAPRDWSGAVTSDDPLIGAPLKHALKNPDLLLYKVKNTAYKYSFVLVPITLPFLWLMFLRRRDVTMYDHVVFSLYSLSFMSLFFSALALLSMLDIGAWFVALLLIVPPLHMFAQLRGTYGISIRAALWRTGLLLLIAASVFILFLTLITVLSVK